MFELLQFTLADSDMKIYPVHHYAYARRGANAAAAFEERFRAAVRQMSPSRKVRANKRMEPTRPSSAQFCYRAARLIRRR